MNNRLSLVAIPLLFSGLIAAAACSSSSNTSTNNGSGTGTGGESCAELEACCPKLPAGTSETSCNDVVTAANQSACATALASAASYCTSTSGTGTGTSNSGTGTGTSNSGTGTGSHSGSGTGTTGAGTCTSPSTVLPAGFVPPTGITPAGCTSAEVTTLGGCRETQPTTDAAINACEAPVSSPDGALNDCGNCVDGTVIIPGQPIPPTWGYNVVAAFENTLGNTSVSNLYGVNFDGEQNLGGCIINSGDTSAKACGLDIMAITACEFAICLPLCAVPETDESQSAFTDFFTCTAAADKGACAKYITSAQTDCGSVETDAGTDPVSKCFDLFNLTEGFVDGGAPTATQQAAAIASVCGGADAGI